MVIWCVQGPVWYHMLLLGTVCKRIWTCAGSECMMSTCWMLHSCPTAAASGTATRMEACYACSVADFAQDAAAMVVTVLMWCLGAYSAPPVEQRLPDL